MWCWKGIENIIWADRLSKEILKIVKKDRNIPKAMKRREAIWNGQTLRRK